MTPMANQQIAWYYYRKRMPEQAEDYFAKLAGLPPSSNADLVRFGRAGLTWMAKMQGREYKPQLSDLLKDHVSTLTGGRPEDLAWMIIENLSQEEGK